MGNQKTNRTGIHRQHDDWDEVHQQLLEVQAKNRIQKKTLAVSNPGDADEKEADDVARKVSNGESAKIHGTGSSVNRKGEHTAKVAPEFQSKLESNQNAGQSLPESVQREMGNKMGADFSGVKVHTGSAPNAMNEQISAKAFTHGNDLYFRDGEYNPSSSQGKELLTHELVHTIQQEKGNNSLLQRAFTPEDAAPKMIGQEFTVDQEMSFKYNTDGKVVFPKGQKVTAESWENGEATIKALAHHTEKDKNYYVYPKKIWLTPVGDSKSGLYQYSSGLSDAKTDFIAGQNKIDDWTSETNKKKYEDAGTLDIYNAQLTNLETLQANRSVNLNEKLIQETMYNTFDAEIVKWVDYYHKEIGEAKGWTKPDANLVKSMVYQESGMGTMGEHLPTTNPGLSYATKTNYNLMQSIDSSGMQQIVMMRDYDAKVKPPKKKLQDQYDYEKSVTDYYNAQDIVKKKEVEKKTLEPAEELIYADAVKRISFPVYNKKTKKDEIKYFWNEYFRSHPNWQKAVTAYFAQTSPNRKLSFDFWIQVGVRWLYEKRIENKSTSWEEAARAFNGSDNASYKKDITSRVAGAKLAHENKTNFIPKQHY